MMGTIQWIEAREVNPKRKRERGMVILAIKPSSSRASGGKGVFVEMALMMRGWK